MRSVSYFVQVLFELTRVFEHLFGAVRGPALLLCRGVDFLCQGAIVLILCVSVLFACVHRGLHFHL